MHRAHFTRPDHGESLHAELPHRTRAFGFGDIVSGVTEFAKDTVGVVKGVAEGAVDTVTGIADAVTHPVETVTGISKLITDPKEAWPAVWHGIVDPIVEDWQNGNPGEAIGRGGWTIFETVFGAKGLTKLGKVGSAANKVDDLADAGKAAKAGEAASKLDEAGDAGKAGKAVDKADEAGDAGKVTPKPEPDAPAPRAIDAANPALRELPRTYDAKQSRSLRHEFKHAKVFDVDQRLDANGTPLSPNKAELDAFQKALEAHVNAPGTKAIRGKYKGEDVVLHIDPATQKAVWFRENGEFWGAKRINDAVLERVLSTGVIGT